jgi:HK97 family phage prohead protease
VGILDRFRFAAKVAADSELSASVGPTFATIGPGDIDPALFGLSVYQTPISPESRISRREAIQVPAVKRARDLIAGTLGGLPVRYLDAQFRPSPNTLLDQPERDVPRSVTMARTFEDLLFEGVAWWRVVEFGWHGYPTRVVRLEPRSVDVRENLKAYVRSDGTPQGSAWEHVPDAELIRFYSPNDPLLDAGARAIRTCLKLDAAAARYADAPMPQGVFVPADGADPADDDDVRDVLDGWESARQTRSTAYVPAALKFEALQWDPSQMQLAEARQHAVLEIARTCGVDPEDLGVSTTSRTYQNAVDRKQALIDFTLAAYINAVQDRLSMGDVTPRGYTARFDFHGFIRSDEKTRFETYQIAATLGVIDAQDIQRNEEIPARVIARPTPPPPAPLPTPTQEVAPVAAEAPPAGATFDAAPTTFGFDTDATAHAFEVDTAKREIFGLAVPYGVTAKKNGRTFQFSKGSLTWSAISRVKLLVQHDRASAVGKAIELEDTPEGLWARFKVARGPEGDRALTLAADGVWDGLSIGLGNDAQFDERGGVLHLSSGPLSEISLTPNPAFDDARVSSVAASADEGNTMTGTATATEPGAAGAAPAPGPTFDATAITDAIAAGFARFTAPAEGRQVVSAAGTGSGLTVNEAPLYRFDGQRAQHCFSSDLKAKFAGDAEAAQRLDEFMGETFNVTVANAATVNPNINRPDLYVDQREYEYPVWSAINKGTLTDNTPFVLPKFGSSSGLVADHVEGTEPTGGAFTTTSQTITPTALSGKAVINREVWDQGGNPQLDSILWRQIVRAYYEGLEQYAVTSILALAPTTITITTAAADAALEGSITSQLAPLQYIRGGNRFRDFFVQVDLYKSLIAAKDTAGRRLFPYLQPHNAMGSVSAFFADVEVAGLIGRPAWALAATSVNTANSLLFDRGDLSMWASAPRKLTMDNIKVATVEIGVWGYKAFACTDLTGLRFLAYDPV